MKEVKVTGKEALDSVKANVENENLVKHILATRLREFIHG